MAEETFAVLRDAMRAAGKVAIARLVMSSRERVVTIGARDKGMFVTTLRDPREGTDLWAVANGLVSLTPLRLELTDGAELARRQGT